MRRRSCLCNSACFVAITKQGTFLAAQSKGTWAKCVFSVSKRIITAESTCLSLASNDLVTWLTPKQQIRAVSSPEFVVRDGTSVLRRGFPSFLSFLFISFMRFRLFSRWIQRGRMHSIKVATVFSASSVAMGCLVVIVVAVSQTTLRHFHPQTLLHTNEKQMDWPAPSFLTSSSWLTEDSCLTSQGSITTPPKISRSHLGRGFTRLIMHAHLHSHINIATTCML